MNRYLLLSAAALLASASGATAKQTTSYCGMKIFQPQKGVFAVQYTDGSTGQGLARKTHHQRFVELSNNSEGNYSSMALSYDLSLPFKSGKWAQWIEFSGTTSFEANSGTCNANSRQGDDGSVTSKVKAMVQARRAARAGQ
jgi:hypothetical protein